MHVQQFVALKTIVNFSYLSLLLSVYLPIAMARKQQGKTRSSDTKKNHIDEEKDMGKNKGSEQE